MKNIITALEQGKRDYKAELDRINTNYVKGSYEYNKAQIKAADDYKAYKLSQVDVFKKELIRAQAQADVLKEMYEKYTGPTDEEIAKGDRAINLIATVGNKLSSDLLAEILEDVKDMQQLRIINDIVTTNGEPTDNDIYKKAAIKRHAEKLEASVNEQENYSELLGQLETKFYEYIERDDEMDFELYSLADAASKIEKYGEVGAKEDKGGE